MKSFDQISRREALGGIATAGAVGIAGCSGGDGGEGGSVIQHDKGESFTVGSGPKSIRYTVTEVTLSKKIGTSSFNTEAEGAYLIVILSLENTEDESIDLLSGYLGAVDSQDREFDPDISANSYIEQDPRFNVEGITWNTLQPGIQQRKAIVFDVAMGESYALKINPVGAFSGTDTHYVGLGNVPES